MADQTRRQIQNHTDAINTIKLINRVQSHAHDELEMTATQLQAAEMLLKRTVPSLTSVEQTMAVSGTVKIAVTLGD